MFSEIIEDERIIEKIEKNGSGYNYSVTEDELSIIFSYLINLITSVFSVWLFSLFYNYISFY